MLKLADTSLILINPSPSNVKNTMNRYISTTLVHALGYMILNNDKRNKEILEKFIVRMYLMHLSCLTSSSRKVY